MCNGNTVSLSKFVVGDKPRPYIQTVLCCVGAGFIPARMAN